VRSVSQMDLRLKEAAKLGFQRAIIPKGASTSETFGLEIIAVGKVIEAIVAALPSQAKAEPETSPTQTESVASQSKPD